MKYARILATTTLLAASATTSFAATSADTKEFVTKAAIAGTFEIESSKMALEKSADADVKIFAKQMIEDHSTASAKLKKTAATATPDVKLPTTLDASHQSTLDKLKATADGNFDDAYIDAQEDAHDDAVSLFSDYAKNGDNAALKQFAADTLPTLKQHKDHIEKIDDKK